MLFSFLHSMAIFLQEQWVTLGKASHSWMLLILSILTYIKNLPKEKPFKSLQEHVLSFGKLPSFFKTKPKINYNKIKKSPSSQGSPCLCLLVLFWFQADVWAQRVIGGKVTRQATIQCQKNKT